MADPRGLHATSPAELKAQLDAASAGFPFLVLRDRDDAQRIYSLGGTTALTLGRDASNDVALEWDAEASRLHAELTRIGAEWTLADDGLSTNGTFVNGRRVDGRRRLRDGDVITCGTTRAVFRSPRAASMEETRPASGATAVPALSPAQRRVLVALCRPFKDATPHTLPATNQQIADELVLTVDAVKTHLRALFDKFAIDDLPHHRKRTRLVEVALMSGAITRREL